MKYLKKFLLNFFNIHISSCILRAKLYKLFGGIIGNGAKIEQVILLNYDGDNLGNLMLGQKVYIGAGTILDLKEKIIIGDSTKIAAGCNFSTHVDCGKENPIFCSYPMRKEIIKIGSDSWIGLNVTVLCGVTIGDGVIVGAASLVNKDLPSHVQAYGVPAEIKNELSC